MEHHTQGTPDHNGQHIDNVSGVPVAVLNNNKGYGTETTHKTDCRHRDGDKLLLCGNNIRAKRILCVHGVMEHNNGTVGRNQTAIKRHHNNGGWRRHYVDRKNINCRGRLENHNCNCRPVDTCTNRGHVKPYGTEWRNIPTTHTQHQGRGGTMARPFPFMADTPSERWRENNPSGTPRHLTRKQSNVRNF